MRSIAARMVAPVRPKHDSRVRFTHMMHLLRRVTLLLLLSLAVAQDVRAAPVCSNRDFNGEYGTIARGTLFVLPPVFAPLLGPVIKVARTIADGNGNVSEFSYVSYNGQIFKEQPYFGTYRVNPDCTIVLDWMTSLPIIVNGALVQFSPPVPLQFVGALADGGSDLLVRISSVESGPPGSIIRVHMQRQNKNGGWDDDQDLACSERNLSGGYQLDLYGEVSDTSRFPWPPSVPILSFARQGTLSFDGKGGFTGDTNASYGGLGVVQETLKGTYTIDSSCNVTILSTSGAPYTWRGVTTGAGEGADLLVTSPDGAVIGGTLLRQRAKHD
jgi:hypothetical protein